MLSYEYTIACHIGRQERGSFVGDVDVNKLHLNNLWNSEQRRYISGKTLITSFEINHFVWYCVNEN